MPPLKLPALKNELDKLGEMRFEQEHPYPVLIGCGVVPGELLDQAGGGTHFLEAPQSGQELTVSHALAARVFPIHKPGVGRVSLGRQSGTDMVVPDFPISKLHCYFERKPNGWEITDAGSSNGSFVNFAKLAPGASQKLESGDALVLGRFGFRFFASAADLMHDPNPTATFLPGG